MGETRSSVFSHDVQQRWHSREGVLCMMMWTECAQWVAWQAELVMCLASTDCG